MRSVIDAIRACKYVYLNTITEPDENQLRIVLLEATTGDPLSEERLAAEPIEALRSTLATCRAIEHVDGCKKFELFWSSYIGYSVINESYSNGEPNESNGRGRLLVEYEKSNYLEYLSKASFATADYPGPFKHWAIYCLNHTIDVASQVEPRVRLLVATNNPSLRFKSVHGGRFRSGRVAFIATPLASIQRAPAALDRTACRA